MFNKMMRRLGLSTIFLVGVSLSAYAQNEPEMVETDHLERRNVEERLQTLGPDLLGDSVDLNTGAANFSTTDVSIPGNFDLPVAFTRSRTQGWKWPHLGGAADGHYDKTTSALGDWSVDIPEISVVVAYGRAPSGSTTRPTYTDAAFNGGGCISEFPGPVVSFGQIPSSSTNDSDEISIGGENSVTFEGRDVSNGLQLSVPGQVSEKLVPVATPANYPSGTTHVTKSHWISKCVNGNPVVTSPNGDVYTFGKLRVRPFEGLPASGFYSVAGGGQLKWSSTVPRIELVLRVTEVKDVHGNWVRYEYNSEGFLDRIYSKDDREITIQRNSTTDLITTVTANNREWKYTHQTSSSKAFLTEVELPDGRKWDIDFQTFPIEENAKIEGADDACRAGESIVSITHPSGVRGEFKFKEISRPLGSRDLAPLPKREVCDGSSFQVSDTYDVIALSSKELTGANTPANSKWTYNYSPHPHGQPNAGLWGEVTDPAGVRSRTTYHSDGVFEGLAQKIEVFSSGGSLVQSTSYDYIAEDAIASTLLTNTNTAIFTRPRHSTEMVLVQDGDTYTTDYTFNTNQSSNSYSFGAPTQITRSSPNASQDRVQQFLYQHLEDKWVLARMSQYSVNSKVYDAYGRNAFGQITDHNKFGYDYATYDYNSDGTLAWAKDALNREVAFSSYYRGIPRTVDFPDGSRVTRTIDSNGWMTGQTDGNGNTTTYTYSSMGWLESVNRPSPWADTTIIYNGLGSGVSQQISKGRETQTIVYDGMHRPLSVQRSGTGGVSSIYSRFQYDGRGLTTFESWPSATSTASAGVSITYDELQRVKSERETVSPNATTSYRYLSSNRVEVTDPENNKTITKYRSFGAPGQTEALEVVDAINVVTTMTRDIHGNITSLSQPGVLRSFVYDDRFRLCRHSAPEFGDELFIYNNANELTAWSRGETGGSGCASSSTASLTTQFEYDGLGREKLINYPGSTPDITKVYDDNGNLTDLNRGGINWDYKYNALNLLEEEKLSIDSRVYLYDYGYSSEGYLSTAKTPESGSASIQYAPDAFGRPTKLSLNGTNFFSNAKYHHTGDLKEVTLANGHSFTSTINNRLLVTSLKAEKTGLKALDLTYAYNDKLPRVTAILDGVDASANRSFTYDGLNRLKTATGPWADSAIYNYDAIGNLEDKSFTYNDGTPTRRVDVVYDPSTNLVQSVAKTGMRAEDIAHVSAVSTFVYDGQQKRVKTVQGSKTTYSVYSSLTGAIGHQDITDSGTQTGIDYLGFGPLAVRLSDGGSPVYTHKDHLGSAVAATNASGGILWREAYTPFGEKWDRADENNDLAGYTGHIDDSSTKLTYMQARYYDPSIGRFLRPDPIGYQDQLNLYAYVRNNPVQFFDPFGEDTRKQQRANQMAAIRQGRTTPNGGGVLLDVLFIAVDVATFPSGEAAVLIGARRAAAQAAKKVGKKGATGPANGRRGRASEARKLRERGLKKNTERLEGPEGGTIPDGIDPETGNLVEIKDVKKLSRTKQMRNQSAAAEERGVKVEIDTGTNTKVSKPLQDDPNVIINRHDDLGNGG